MKLCFLAFLYMNYSLVAFYIQSSTTFSRLVFDKAPTLLYLMRFPNLESFSRKSSNPWKNLFWRAGSSVGRAFDF